MCVWLVKYINDVAMQVATGEQKIILKENTTSSLPVLEPTKRKYREYKVVHLTEFYIYLNTTSGHFTKFNYMSLPPLSSV